MDYQALKSKQAAELEAFPIQFAFNDQQFAEGMAKLGLAVTDTDKVVSVLGGGFVRKTDADALLALFKRHREEKRAEIAADTDGTGYVFQMFDYELKNHEYSYTYDPEPALSALGLKQEEVKASPILSAAFERAKKEQFRED